jgi:cell division ATPase FtsA
VKSAAPIIAAIDIGSNTIKLTVARAVAGLVALEYLQSVWIGLPMSMSEARAAID